MYSDIANHFIFPFMRKNYRNSLNLHQDNAKTHHAKIAKNAIQNIGVNWIQSPPYSPDLNPIEWVWADLKRYVRKARCTCENDVMMAVKEIQNKMTPEYCQRYINKLKKVVQIVLQKKGEWSNC